MKYLQILFIIGKIDAFTDSDNNDLILTSKKDQFQIISNLLPFALGMDKKHDKDNKINELGD